MNKAKKKRAVTFQRGHVFRAGAFWYGRWRRDELVSPEDLTDKERLALGPNHDGSKVRVRRQHAEKLAEYSDRYRSEKDVQPLLDAKLLPTNDDRDRPESTLTVADYAQNYFLSHAERELKKSTAYGYKNIFRIYLKSRLTKIALRDFRCVHATNILAAIHREHGLSKKSLRHCKALLSVIFTFAKRSGVVDGMNPAKDAGIPRAAVASEPTHAYTAEEVFAMLNALEGVAKTAVALMYFCGLRPGEARAARWDDYDGKTLCIRASMWRTHLTEPKTAESVAPVPIGETLRDILAESRRDSGFILAAPSGKAIDLHNLAYRVVVPKLALCAKCEQKKEGHDKEADHEFGSLPKWIGWYGFRRGVATLATSVDSRMAAKSLLRHSNIATTEQFYIKSVPADAVRAMATIDALFQKSAHAIPN
jgi:integrase